MWVRAVPPAWKRPADTGQGRTEAIRALILVGRSLNTRGSEKRAVGGCLVRSFKIGLAIVLLLSCSSHHNAGVKAALQPAATRAESRPRRVLLLHSFGREFAPYSVFSGTFRTELAQQMGAPVEYFDVALES